MKGWVKHEGEHTQVGIIPSRMVQVTGEMVQVSVPSEGADEPPPPAEAPQVELLREADVIQAIEVTCTCGRKIRLRCLY